MPRPKLDVVDTHTGAKLVRCFPLPALVFCVSPDDDLRVLSTRSKDRARAVAAKFGVGPCDLPDGARVTVISMQFLDFLPLAIGLARPYLDFLV